MFFFKKEKEEEREREGRRALVPFFIRVLETNISKIALIIYKNTAIFIKIPVFPV
jgi:hypothetical protein